MTNANVTVYELIPIPETSGILVTVIDTVTIGSEVVEGHHG